MECPLDHCEHKLSGLDELDQHTKTVHKKAWCYLCGKDFSGKVAVKTRNEHIRNLHMGDKYRCSNCSKLYSSRGNAFLHVKKCDNAELVTIPGKLKIKSPVGVRSKHAFLYPSVSGVDEGSDTRQKLKRPGKKFPNVRKRFGLEESMSGKLCGVDEGLGASQNLKRRGRKYPNVRKRLGLDEESRDGNGQVREESSSITLVQALKVISEAREDPEKKNFMEQNGWYYSDPSSGHLAEESIQGYTAVSSSVECINELSKERDISTQSLSERFVLLQKDMKQLLKNQSVDRVKIQNVYKHLFVVKNITKKAVEKVRELDGSYGIVCTKLSDLEKDKCEELEAAGRANRMAVDTNKQSEETIEESDGNSVRSPTNFMDMDLPVGAV